MKKIITILFILLCAVHSASAQKFLDELQKKQQGQGSVTVTQSKEITDLVNGTAAVKGTTNSTSPTTTTPQDDKTAAQKEKEKEEEKEPNSRDKVYLLCNAQKVDYSVKDPESHKIYCYKLL